MVNSILTEMFSDYIYVLRRLFRIKWEDNSKETHSKCQGFFLTLALNNEECEANIEYYMKQ